MTTLYLEVSNYFVSKVVTNGLAVVVDKDMGRHWTGAPKNVAAGEQKARKEEERPKKQSQYCHLC